MRYIETFREGLHISDVYLCKNKQIALTKAGKEYGNLILQDKRDYDKLAAFTADRIYQIHPDTILSKTG